MAYNLSETVTKMTLDFSSLYNVDFDKTVQKFQSALSKQVRPIRSVSGYDITQSVLAGTAQSLGIDRSISQMNELEKRLLVILTLMQQMRNSGAMNDFARTIEQPANQLRILQEQLQEVGRWLGSVFYGIIGGILPYINGFVMALKEVIKMLALFVGYEIPNSSGETGTILDSYGDSMDDFNSGLSDAGNAIDKNKKKAKEWKNVLMGFDVANVLPDQSSSDTSGGSSGGGIGGMSVDPKILDALNKYKYLFDDIHMKAQDIRDELLNWANIAKQSFKENIFQPIKNSWDKYGSGITNNLKGTFENIKYLVSDSARVIGENWKPMFQEISNLSLSIDTVTFSMRSLTDCFVIAWDNGGNYLLENLMKFVKSCAELGTSLLDNFAKPLIDMFSNTIGKFVFTVIGKLLGAVGGLLKTLSDLFGIISKNKALVSALGGVFLALYSSIKIGQFVALVKMFGGVGEAIGMIASKIPILSTLLKGLFTTTSNAGGAFTALKTALGLSSGALLGIVAGIGALIGAFTYLWNTNENFRNKMSEIWDRISSSVGDVLDKIGSSLMSLWNDILKPFLNFASETLAPVFVYCFEAIGDTALAVLGIFSGLLEFITGVFTLNWKQAWEGVETIFSSIFDFICSIGQTALDLICDTFRPIADWFNDNVIKPIKNFFSPIADWFNKNVVQPIMNFFSPLFEWFGKLFGSIAETIRSAFDVIGQLAQGCWNIIVACWQIASTWFDNNIAKPIKNTFSDAWSALKQGASDAWEGIKSTFGKVSKFSKNTFTDAWTKVKNVFRYRRKKFSTELKRVS